MIEGLGECRVLYRWRTNPTSCVVYVRPIDQKTTVAA
jgi:hypothetical protein